MESEVIREQALANDEANFAYGFDPQYESVLLDRHEMNSELVQRFLRDPAFKTVLTDWARGEAYRRIRDEHAQTG
jgi:hypothetical protein